MSGISSSVGLVSGINHSELIDQLMAIEARPRDSVKQRIKDVEAVKTAWMSLSAGLLGMKLPLGNFGETSSFERTSVSSSNTSVLSATAEAGASLGTYQFTVRRLVQTHQTISRGFADKDAGSVGAGTITVDLGRGKLNPATELDFLNGQEGVRTGTVRITDRAGTTVDVDLTEATNVAEVIDTINNESSLGVRASVQGDSIVLSDTTGLAGTITVADVGMGSTASDLGIAGSATDADLVGADILYVTEQTNLSQLNDGVGIERTGIGDDLVITLRDGTEMKVNLSGQGVGEGGELEDYTALTLGDVLDAINNHEDNGGKLIASINDDNSGIKLTDTTGGAGDLVVADGVAAGGYESRAATQLGIAGTYSGGGAELQADGSALIAGLNTVLLNSLDGGNGLTAGVLDLQDRLGNTASIDLTGATSLADVINAINGSSQVSLEASLNEAGNGIRIVDTTGATDFRLVVADASGDIAAKLGIAVDDNVSEVVGQNANLKYVSAETALDDFVLEGDWVGGSVRVTNSDGVAVTVNLGSSNIETVGDVIRNLNSNLDGLGVTARINDSGTGILLEDANGGANALKVENVTGSRAASLLGLAGEAAEGEAFIDGSLRGSLEIAEGDSLQDVASAINEAGMGVTATIINDGSSTNPYRLVISSDKPGTSGEIVWDAGDTGLGMTTFVEAKDALVFLGAPGSANAITVTSETNQLDDLIDGVTIDLKGTDTNPVTITVNRDDESIVGMVSSFVESFNKVVDSVNEYTRFNPETLEKGVLFGDSSVGLLRTRLFNMVLGSVDVNGSYNSINQVGVRIGAGNKLTFDEEKFREALATDREGVVNLFTQAAETREVQEGGQTVEEDVPGTGGIGAVFEEVLNSLADDYDGLIANVTEGLDSRTEMLNDRVEQLNELLSAKRARLERQFAAMESALAQLQGQQSALSSLSGMASQASISSSAKK